jgi:hypothetical protein
MPNMKKPAPPRGFVQRTPSTGTGVKKPMPKTVTKAPAKKTSRTSVPSEISKGEAIRDTPSKTTTTMTQASAKSTGRNPVFPKTTKKAPAKPVKKPGKMTPQDAAMKKILEKKYGKIYG